MGTLRKPVSLLLVLLVAGMTAGSFLYRPPAARADIGPIPTPDPCHLLPNGTARSVCEAAMHPVSTVTNAVGLPDPVELIKTAVTDAAKPLVKEVLTVITQAEGDAVLSSLKQMNSTFSDKTTPDMNVGWFINQYELLAGMGIGLALLFSIFRVGMGKFDPTETGKAGAAIMVYVVMLAFVVPLVAGIIKVTDDVFTPQWMSLFANNGSNTLTKVETDFSNSMSVIGAVAAILTPLIILFVGVVASVVFGFMLLFRYEVIFIVAGMLPLAGAFAVGGRWGGQIFHKTSWTLIGWIIMKPVMAIILTFGLAIMTQGGGAEPISLGAGILILSVGATWKITQVVARHNIRPPHEVFLGSTAGRALSAKLAALAMS